jgi:hypothetical protein
MSGRAASSAPDLERALGELVAKAVDARLRELGIAPGMVDPVVPVVGALPVKRTKATEICRSGAIEGAKRIGRVWVARRSAIDAYVASLPAPTAENDDEDEEHDEVDDELAKLGFAG